MKTFATVLLAFFLCACSNINALKKPETTQTITINKDYYEKRKGIFDSNIVTGINPGIYTSIGENEKGTFFTQEGKSTFTLIGKDADFYVENNRFPEKNEIRNFSPRIRIGGIFIPKNKYTDVAKIFYIGDGHSSQTGMIGQLDLFLIITSLLQQDQIFFITITSRDFIRSIKVNNSDTVSTNKTSTTSSPSSSKE
ncbi:hypothetical protein KIK84_10470 [Curvibacter sp. CHRR-16]|uniref:hypothetical protein n=1 Tax=Curvibacter sp. CHRR-16 TaxID=2835872 RepID=UPI001BD978C6|nr:hypothetical protein [Curvibacter sp. CHRR-16]MBT0570753.1 hypothetical protein [Curvibacter sp. CHRR-16]